MIDTPSFYMSDTHHYHKGKHSNLVPNENFDKF